MNGANPLLEALLGSWLAPRPAGGGVCEANGLLSDRVLGRDVELVVVALALDGRSVSIASKSKASEWESEVYRYLV